MTGLNDQLTVTDPGHLVKGAIYIFHVFSGNFRKLIRIID